MLPFLRNFFLNTKCVRQFIDVKQNKDGKDNKNGDHHRFPPSCSIYVIQYQKLTKKDS
jgi:hypothetical protein